MDVLIVEDDPLHRSYLHEQVKAALPECGTIPEAENGQQGEVMARAPRGAYHDGPANERPQRHRSRAHDLA